VYQGRHFSRSGGIFRRKLRLRRTIKAAIFPPMHFSRHISQHHSTFSLLAALKLRVAR